MTKLIIVVGGQYGSEAKGHVTGYLAAKEDNPLVLRVGGSQAGHSVIDPQTGDKTALRHVPVAAVTNRDATLGIAAGSEIDLGVLAEEIRTLDHHGYKVSGRLFVDDQATIIDSQHKEQEMLLNLGTRIGSTTKGVGAARASRVLRTAGTARDHRAEIDSMGACVVPRLNIMAMSWLREDTVIIEGAQGLALGLHYGHYPWCTSSDCRAIDALAMAGISPWDRRVQEIEPWVVFRTFPIRVAGNSGPMYSETTWSDLADEYGQHIRPELTTVTQKVRRVGRWDSELAARAIAENGGERVRAALMFVDYLEPGLSGETDPDALQQYPPVVETIGRWETQIGKPFSLLGTGPGTIIDTRPGA